MEGLLYFEKTLIHNLLHLIVPALVVWVGFKHEWKKVGFLLMLSMAVDLDHMFADPVFDPNRCSIGFHPLHVWPAILGYLILLLPRRFRIFAIGLLIHMGLDGIDCVWMAMAST